MKATHFKRSKSKSKHSEAVAKCDARMSFYTDEQRAQLDAKFKAFVYPK